MKQILLAIGVLLVNSVVLAADTVYTIRVDGLACPYCAYGIEKKLKKIEGVKKIDIDLDNGRVMVRVSKNTTLSEPQMKKLFKDAGFTYRSMMKKDL